MNASYAVTADERIYLRELAKKYLEYAHLPIMTERAKLWYDHNALNASRPMIVMEQEPFEKEIMPIPKCTSAAALEIEKELQEHIVNFELINDDKVISPWYTIKLKINLQEFGIDIKREFAKDSSGRSWGYKEFHPITDIDNDFHLLKPSTYTVDRESTHQWKIFVEEVLGDLMPVKIINDSLRWNVAITSKIINLMGLEAMMYSMVDSPNVMHKLMDFIKDDLLTYIHWQEQENLLTLNNGNHYAGAGSYGFTNELPSDQYRKTGKVTPKDLWVNMNSQETVGISPKMFEDFIFPYYQEIAKEFGLIYYGCCEPVHNIWDNCISKLHGLRKVSISPWCDEEFMGERLRGSNVIYSRKPSPNFVGVGSTFDAEGYRQHIAKTVKAARGCHLEIICRDILTVNGDITKPGKAIEIMRKEIDRLW